MNASHTPSPFWKRQATLVLLLLVGVGVVLAATLIKRPPKPVAVSELAVKVRVIKVTPLEVVPRVRGYGRVQPASRWDAVAEVEGQVVWLAEALQSGHIVSAGSELLRIDDALYRLNLAQAEAQLLAAEEKSRGAEEALALAKKNLRLLEKEFQRQQALAKQGTVSRTTLDASERQLLAGQSQVESQQSALRLQRAEAAALMTRRDVAELELQRTVIRAPFDVRITAVDSGVGRYAGKGQLLFKADGLAVAEVEAQFPVGVMRPLMRDTGTLGDAALPSGLARLSARVRLETASHSVEWDARVARAAGSIDPQTQSLGVIVAVDEPQAQAVPGERPPLLRDTFVEVELASAPLSGRLVVPRAALHEGRLYVINDASRLELRPVEVAFSLHGYSVIASGLAAGERIVTSELPSAVEGMLLTPVEDRKSKRRLIIEATGRDPKA